MKAETREMLDKVDNTYDWNIGQVTSGGETKLSSTDICQVCLLRRHYYSDTQNGIKGQYRFSDGENGADLSLRQAIARGCAHA